MSIYKFHWFIHRTICSCSDYLVSSHPVAGVHNERFPSLITLSRVQARLLPLVLYLEETGGNGTDCGFVKLFKQKGFLRDPMHSGKPQRPDKPRRNTGTSQPLCTHSPRQTAAGWDRAWRPPDRRSSNTRKSSYIGVCPGDLHAWRRLQKSAVERDGSFIIET